MTMLDLWYFSAKSFKNFAGGKDNFSAIAGAITSITKTFHVQAISNLFWCIWTIDNMPLYYLFLYAFLYDILADAHLEGPVTILHSLLVNWFHVFFNLF